MVIVLRCLLVERKENLTDVSTGLTGRSKNLDPIDHPTGFHLCCSAKRPNAEFYLRHFHLKNLVRVFNVRVAIKNYNQGGPYVVFEVEYLRNGGMKKEGVNANPIQLPKN